MLLGYVDIIAAAVAEQLDGTSHGHRVGTSHGHRVDAKFFSSSIPSSSSDVICSTPVSSIHFPSLSPIREQKCAENYNKIASIYFI